MHKRLFFLLLFSVATFISAQAQQPGLSDSPPTDGPQIKTEAGYMVPYSCTLPGTQVKFEMVPIPGGKFLMGSPEGESDRNDDEGPQVEVEVAPFWMGKCEVTWAEYRTFMNLYPAFKKLDDLNFMRGRDAATGKLVDSLENVKAYLDQAKVEVDGVTCPTPLYDSSFTYAVGEEPDQPAVTMTQFAAKQYTKWLSGITGQQFRLPTEAEWEYAARAGTSSAYSFGDDPEELEEYAWYEKNSDYETHPVASLASNPWGLYDMHGNVGEWVLDAYADDYYGKLQSGVAAKDAVNWPTELFPRVIRGGNWQSPAADCRSAARQQSEDSEWVLEDPNLPTSPWWFTEEQSTGIGFRLVRPLVPMDESLQKKVWDADLEQISQDVSDRMTEGRGARAAATPDLPAAIDELKSSGQIE